MFVIAEGPDGAGKTSFVNALAEYCLSFRGQQPVVMHRGQPDKPPLYDYLYCVNEFYYPGDGVDVLCDRWHWGELIYGPLYRGKSGMTPKDRDMIDSWLRDVGAVIVHLTNDEDTLRTRHENVGEDFLRPEHVQRVITEYYDVARKSVVPVITFRDHTIRDVTDVFTIGVILEEAAARLRRG